jgi:hypothetical protein
LAEAYDQRDKQKANGEAGNLFIDSILFEGTTQQSAQAGIEGGVFGARVAVEALHR